ncbi:hypothetical protein K402DRAFT_236221 [Aulographum hederae CBS 113979]|uniref:Uncharacterized protein n=1 Tax=Aulographum hederae CBS 113979 TaxID=1176131 RepID=A0A6G1GL77_9PEZI|nr:hypothetical protein K402DRAFT_236221 [Aulographum hederae CBS 113979]
MGSISRPTNSICNSESIYSSTRMGCLLGHHNKSLREVMAQVQHQPPTDPKNSRRETVLNHLRMVKFCHFFVHSIVSVTEQGERARTNRVVLT